MTSKSSPPKPWEVRKSSTANSSVPVSSSVARSALEPTDTNVGLPLDPSGRSPHIAGSSNSGSSPRVPPRPGMGSTGTYGSSYGSPYNSLSTSRYGSGYGSSYGSGYGSSAYGGSAYGGSGYGGYGSSYGSGYGSTGYGGIGSSYGSGYGSRYGSSGYGGYGSSSYGGYGSSYGSSYGGYGSSYGSTGYGNNYGRYGYGYRDGPAGPAGPNEGGAFQNMLNGGYNQMNRFGMVVESFSRFSRLLDANFEALHGSFASVIRLLDVFGEFFYVVRTFAVFRLLFGGVGKSWRILNFLLGRATNKKAIGNGKEGLELEDYQNFQSNQKRGRIPMMLVMMGIIFVSLPLLVVKMWRVANRMKLLEGFEDVPLEDAWKTDAPGAMLRAKHSFAGETEMDLPFREGESIRLLGKPFPDWWEGEINGRKGLFPANFVEEISEQPNKQM